MQIVCIVDAFEDIRVFSFEFPELITSRQKGNSTGGSCLYLLLKKMSEQNFFSPEGGDGPLAFLGPRCQLDVAGLLKVKEAP